MRTREQFKGDVLATLRRKGLWLLALLLIAAVVYASVGWEKHGKAVVELEQQKEKTARFTYLLATVMNGGTLFDHATETGYFFDKPTVVSLGEKK